MRKFSDKYEGIQLLSDKKVFVILDGLDLILIDTERNIKTKIGEHTNRNQLPMIPYKLSGTSSFSISPDEKKVTYDYNVFNYDDDWQPSGTFPQVDNEIFVYDIENGDTINITNTPNQWEANPRWSPDGKYILCFVYSGNEDKTRKPIIIEWKLSEPTVNLRN